MFLVPVYAQPATVTVEWQEPETYSDIRPGNESKARFQKRTFAELDEYLQKLGEELPEDQSLKIKVTDLDLAGQVWPSSFVGYGGMGGGDIRVIKSIDIPRIQLSYELLDSQGKVLKTADVKVKDLAFMERGSMIRDSDALRYEKRMLKEWFTTEMGDYLVKN
jgi:hypothetical protein